MSCWIADASPLIFLSKLDRLVLLRQAADEVVVPSKVMAEVLARPDTALRRVREAGATWLRVHNAPEPRKPRRDLGAQLDAGETEVLLLALEMKADRVVLDDLAARRTARHLGVPSIGTLGILLAAKLRGELPSLQMEIEQLREYGFRVSEPLVDAVLVAAGESLGRS